MNIIKKMPVTPQPSDGNNQFFSTKAANKPPAIPSWNKVATFAATKAPVIGVSNLAASSPKQPADIPLTGKF